MYSVSSQFRAQADVALRALDLRVDVLFAQGVGEGAENQAIERRHEQQVQHGENQHHIGLRAGDDENRGDGEDGHDERQQLHAHGQRQLAYGQQEGIAQQILELQVVGDHHGVDDHFHELPHDEHHQHQTHGNVEQQGSCGHGAVELPAEVQNHRRDAADDRHEQRLLPVGLHRVPEIAPDEAVLVARPVAHDVGDARGEGAGDGDARRENQQIHGQIAQRVLRFGGGQHHQVDDRPRRGGQPGDDVQQVHADHGAPAHLQHLAEELEAVLRHILDSIVALPGLAVEVIVHHVSEQTHKNPPCNPNLPEVLILKEYNLIIT